MRYYLSTSKTSGGVALVTGTRSVGSLTAGKTSSGNANVTVPVGTSVGTYYLLACADDLGAVAELDEGNNCIASVNAVTVR